MTSADAATDRPPLLRIETPKSLSRKVMLRLRQAIVDGEFPFGGIIAEEMLAQSFGVSRTPVREALSQLQAQGLVVVRPQVGSFVFTPSAEDVAALCTFRIALEPRAVELAHLYGKAPTIAALTGAIAGMERAIAAADNVAYGRADTELHETFFAHCGNRYLCDAYQLIAGRVAALRTAFSAPIDVRTPDSFKEHQMFLEYFQGDDLSALERVLKRHVERSYDVYSAALAPRA